jgi:hypothetical protein
LSPLRTAKLVVPGTLRVTPAADAILEAFWDEPESNARAERYDAYARDPSVLSIEAWEGRQGRRPSKYGQVGTDRQTPADLPMAESRRDRG